MYLINLLSSRVNKDDGNGRADERTDAGDENNPLAEKGCRVILKSTR